MFLVCIAAAPPAMGQSLPEACPERATLQRADAAESVIVVQLGEGLSCALTAALAAWGLRVVSSEANNPGPSMPSTSVSAQRLSRTHSARLVVWLARDAEGYALWVYDAEQDRTVARPAPAPPYDGPTAAALALSVKTVVRMVGVGPEASAPGTSSPEAAAQETIPQARLEPPPRAAEATVGVRSAQAPTRAPEDQDETTDTERQTTDLWVGGFAALRPLDEGLTSRLGAEVRWAPGQERGSSSRLWLGLGAEAGPSRAVDDAAFSGRLSEIGGEVSLGITHAVTPWFALGAAASGALAASTLAGTFSDERGAVDQMRVNPLVLLKGELQLRWSPVALYLQPAVGTWLRRQRYVLSDTAALHTPRRALRAVAGLLIELN